MRGEHLPVVSPSLLPSSSWKEGYQFDPNFDLGIGEWMGEGNNVIASNNSTLAQAVNTGRVEDKENVNEGIATSSLEESRKRKGLSLKRTCKKKAMKEPSERFCITASENEINAAMKGVIPINTETSTKWAVKNFNDWMNNYNKIHISDPVPTDLLKCHDAERVCKYLCKYVLETRKTDGTKYPPGTIKSLIAGLNRELQLNKAPFSLFDKVNPQCRELCNTLDVICSDLHKQGIGAEKHSAPVISKEHEKMFWELGLLGYSSPKVLQRSVFFMLDYTLLYEVYKNNMI